MEAEKTRISFAYCSKFNFMLYISILNLQSCFFFEKTLLSINILGKKIKIHSYKVNIAMNVKAILKYHLLQSHREAKKEEILSYWTLLKLSPMTQFPTNKMRDCEWLLYTILFAMSSYRSVFFLIFKKLSFSPLDHPY